MDLGRKQVRIHGIVQGVGFRPFIYRMAHRFHLHGHVRNTGDGVFLEVEGAPRPVEEFLAMVVVEHPPLALIQETLVAELEPTGETGFAVRHSDQRASFTLVSPDLATCADCRRELADPYDRRFGYPFLNCTNCGPRYSIVRDLPYDRAATSMAAFRMCSQCQAEYDDPENRRFHAQPNACPACGPCLTLEAPGTAPLMIVPPLSRRRGVCWPRGASLPSKVLGDFSWRAMPPATRPSGCSGGASTARTNHSP